MANFRPIDSKREEFRKYLERAGVMESLTKVLISLYEEQEKPSDALEYVRQKLKEAQPAGADNDELNALKEENVKLKERLAQYEGGVSKSQTPYHSEQSVHSTASGQATKGAE